MCHEMLVQNGAAGRRCNMLSNDQIYVFTWVSPPPSERGRSKLQNPIFTGCSHKAIAEHAGLSTAQLQQELQQQVVKAKLL